MFDTTTENGVRAWFDAVSTATYSVRTKWEYSQKRTDTSDEDAAHFLDHFGEQPLMRHYDLAERDRNRVTVLANLNMTDTFIVNASVAAGKDDYVTSGFGLRDNTHGVYTVGFDSMPTEMFSYGMSYSFENYKGTSYSRSASNNVVQFNDPARNWGTDAEDKVHSFILNFAARGISDVFDIVLAYDFNQANSTYVYALSDQIDGPGGSPAPVLNPIQQLPEVFSQFNRLTSDFIYDLNDRVSIGFSYWFEDYDVRDFTLDADANEDLVKSGSVLLLGYLYRPYTASTYWGRIIFRF